MRKRVYAASRIRGRPKNLRPLGLGTFRTLALAMSGALLSGVVQGVVVPTKPMLESLWEGLITTPLAFIFFACCLMLMVVFEQTAACTVAYVGVSLESPTDPVLRREWMAPTYLSTWARCFTDFTSSLLYDFSPTKTSLDFR
jgi:hypothetical protein